MRTLRSESLVMSQSVKYVMYVEDYRYTKHFLYRHFLSSITNMCILAKELHCILWMLYAYVLHSNTYGKERFQFDPKTILTKKVIEFIPRLNDYTQSPLTRSDLCEIILLLKE